MSPRKAGKPVPEVVHVPPPEAKRGTLKALGGSANDDFNNILANQVVQSLWLANSDKDGSGKQIQAALAAMLDSPASSRLNAERRREGGLYLFSTSVLVGVRQPQGPDDLVGEDIVEVVVR